MKRRIAKKYAKSFLSGRRAYPTVEEPHQLDSDGNYCIKTVAVMPEPVRRELFAIARRNGWSGCHWDAPDVVLTWVPAEATDND